MKGLIVVNKPINMTSRDVVNTLTTYLGCSKIGHTGTLDPIATGTLVCLVGSYTKLNNLIMATDKEYIAKIKLGISTDTLDITGNICNTGSYENVTKEKILKVFKEFSKTYNQTVPSYSAVKIKGHRLYEYARKNQEVVLPQRTVHIYSLELISFNKDIITFKTKVSKGTYIRSLIMDICKSLNTLGTMASLMRTKQGIFSLDDSYTITDISNNNYKLLKVKDFLNYPVIEVDDTLIKKINNGNKIRNTYDIKDKVIFTFQNTEIAIYEKEDSYLRQYVKL